MPSSAGRSGWPARNTMPPRFRSSPAKRRFCPAWVTAPGATATPPSTSRARSCITTLSAPAGITAPVKMRTACPAPTVPAKGLPANDSPMRARRVSLPGARSAKRTAQPSIAELSWPGTSTGETTSSASTRPSACRTCTRSIAVTGTRKRRISSRARSTGIEFGS